MSDVPVRASQWCLKNAPAQTARLSTDTNAAAAGERMDLSECTFASFHVIWASLTGTLDAEVRVEVSNDGANWDTKNAASVTMTTANGNQIISLNNVVTEEFYRVRLTPNNVTGGTVNVHGRGK